MDTEHIPQEEKDLEAEVAKRPDEEEIRKNVIAEYGFDEVDDAERINKLVAKEVDHKTKLFKAIEQKRKYRDDPARKPATPPNPDNKNEPPKGVAPEDVGKMLDERLEQRDLDEMPHSEDIKKEIKRIAQIQGVSVKQAARDPYIVAKIDEEKKAKAADDAAISRNNRQGGKKTFSTTPPDVDMTTKEGQEEWDAWKKWMAENGN